jgi:hypothetical protein
MSGLGQPYLVAEQKTKTPENCCSLCELFLVCVCTHVCVLQPPTRIPSRLLHSYDFVGS